MTINDLAQVMAIENNNHPYPWSEKIMSDCFKDNYESYVYVLDNQIVGYIVQVLAADESNILNICVDESHRQLGIAKKLMDNAIEYSSSADIKTVFLEVRSSNNAAINLYVKSGFTEVGLRKGYYPSGSGREDAIVMALEVQKFS